MITIKSEKKHYGINFPTSLNEIKPEDLNAITKNVTLPKNYCIIALCYKTKVFDFCTMIDNNKNVEISVVPLIAKINKEDSEKYRINVGDKVTISRSSLEMGDHIKLPTMISSDNVRKYFKDDPDLKKAIITKNSSLIIDKDINKQLLGTNSPNIIIMEFKIVPINDIRATMPVECDIYDPYAEHYKVIN